MKGLKTITIPYIGYEAIPMALGTDYYGKLISEQDAGKIIQKFLDLGGSILDTAHVYSDYLPGEKHMSEKVIGRWLKQNGHRRDIFIGTKGGFPPIGHMEISRISKEEIASDMDESLECLQTDHIDLYWLHRDNVNVEPGEVVEWMNDFIRAGKIKSFAVSNWRAERIIEGNRYAQEHGLQGFSGSQIRWSLAKIIKGADKDVTLVDMDDEEYKAYEKANVPVFAFSSQAKGYFPKLEMNSLKGKSVDRYDSEENRKVYQKLKDMSSRYNITVAKLALLWLLYSPFDTVPVVGCKSVEQLESSIKGLGEAPEIEEFKNHFKIYE